MLHSNRIVLVGEVLTTPSRDAHDNTRFDLMVQGCVDDRIRSGSSYEVIVARSPLADFCESEIMIHDTVCVDGTFLFDAFERRIVAGSVLSAVS